jgi:TM2 domain/GYF domain 2/Uncharacterised protein family UPF0547
MANEWYALVMGEQLGPLTDDELREMAFKQQLMPDGMVRTGASAKWVPASRVRGLFDSAPAGQEPRGAASATSPPTQAATISRDVVRDHPAPEFTERAAVQSKRLISCPDCERNVSQNAQSCPHCGHSFFRPSRSTAIALAWLLGGFGIHKFYLRRPSDGIAALMFCWTFILTIFALVEGFQYLAMDDETFTCKFGSRPKLGE